MTKYALQLEYDGSCYFGWQMQASVISVQQVLEAALSRFANHPVATITAGRTDTGVHGLNQVVHFESTANRRLQGWIDGVNANLPASVRVKQVAVVAPEFDARFSALSRTYHYYLLVRRQNSAHLHKYVGWYHQELDLALMQQASSLLIGRHDFSAFRASGCQAKSPIRDMYTIQVEERGNMLRFSLTANAFLHHMVRNIVGALVYVGAQRLSVEQFANLLNMADRRLAPPTFMANGLYLVDVSYPQPPFAAYQDSWLFN